MNFNFLLVGFDLTLLTIEYLFVFQLEKKNIFNFLVLRIFLRMLYRAMLARATVQVNIDLSTLKITQVSSVLRLVVSVTAMHQSPRISLPWLMN
jgi:hypothetical protein